MPKKNIIKLLDVVPKEKLSKLTVEVVNLTTESKTTFETVNSKFMPPKDELVALKYGTGPLSYEGQGDFDATMLGATSKTGSSYLIRSVGSKAYDKLNKIVTQNSSQLPDLKISSSQAVGGLLLPSGVDAEQLIPKAVLSQQNLGSKRTKVSVSSDGVFQIGSNTSTKCFKIAVAKDDASPSNNCLSIYSSVKETENKHIQQMDKLNLDLGDIHLLSLRSAFESLNDCQLKELILRFIKQEYSLPAKDKMKEKPSSEALLPKAKYLESALKSGIKYLEDQELSVQSQSVVNKFLTTLAFFGWINKIRFYSDRKATSSVSKEDMKDVWPEFLKESSSVKEEKVARVRKSSRLAKIAETQEPSAEDGSKDLQSLQQSNIVGNQELPNQTIDAGVEEKGGKNV
jgi:hypothetical protein